MLRQMYCRWTYAWLTNFPAEVKLYWLPRNEISIDRHPGRSDRSWSFGQALKPLSNKACYDQISPSLETVILRVDFNFIAIKFDNLLDSTVIKTLVKFQVDWKN